MYRKLLTLSLAVLFALSLVACNPEVSADDPVNQGQSSADTTDPTYFYEEVSDLITVDAKVIGRTPGEIPSVYVGTLPELNQEAYHQFLEALDDSVSEVLTDISESEYEMFVTKTKNGALAGFNTAVGFSYNISYSADSYTYYGVAVSNYGPYERVKYQEEDNTEYFTEPKSFAFASPEEADAQARALLEVLGIQNAILVETLYLDHATLSEQYQIQAPTDKIAVTGNDVPDKDSWTSADDAYYLTYEIGYPDIRLIPTYQPVGTNENYVSSTFRIVWGAEGCIYLQGSNPWIFGEVVETGTALISAQEALDEAIAILNLAPTDYERVINEVSLRYYYAQDGDRYLLRPCWNISVLSLDVPQIFMGQEIGEPMDELNYILLDAYTGQEL